MIYIYKYAKCTLTLTVNYDTIVFSDTYTKTLSSSDIKAYLVNDSYLSYNSGNSSISTGSLVGQHSNIQVCSTSLTSKWDTSDVLNNALYDSIKVSVTHTGGISGSSETSSATKTLICYAPIDQSKLS